MKQEKKNSEIKDDLPENNNSGVEKNKKIRPSVVPNSPKIDPNTNKETRSKDNSEDVNLGNILKYGSKDGIDNYYHANITKITFSIYNFSTRFVEVVKDKI